MKAHPIAECWRLLDGEDLDALARSIEAHGLLQPITLYEGQILDGRNRAAACDLAGVEPRFESYGGDDPIGFVRACNDERRHDDPSQRAMVAARLANMEVGNPDYSANLQNRGVSVEQAADHLSVSPRSVHTARDIQRNGSPELIEAVERGEIAVSTAAKIARSPTLAPLMSSDSDEWYTPDHVLEDVFQALGDVDLDPCSDPDGNVAAGQRFTKEDDGLAREWRGRVFMNPPYSEIGRWADKIMAEVAAGRVSSFVALVPARTDTAWWDVLAGGSPAVCLIRGRLKFKGGQSSAPFPSALICHDGGGGLDPFIAAFDGMGTFWGRL